MTCLSQFVPGLRRRGAMLIVLAVALPIFVIMAAFAINVAYMELTRTELRAATDFSARAAARKLSMTGSQSQALDAATQVAAKNLIATQNLVVDTQHVEFGTVDKTSNGTAYVYVPGGPNPNAVQVTGIGAGVSHDVTLFFGNALGVSQFTPTMRSVASQADRDIAIVLDRSGSMAAKTEAGQGTSWQTGDPAPSDSRWVRAVDATLAFLQALDSTPMDEKVSLVTYNQSAVIDSDLTLDYSAFPGDLDTYTQAYVDGWTNIGDGIDVGRQTLVGSPHHRPWAQMTIVVLTDGIHNTGTTTPLQAALTAAAQGVTVHTVTFGNDANEADMAAVAAAGNGTHWHAPSQSELIKIFNEIANNSPTMLVE